MTLRTQSWSTLVVFLYSLFAWRNLSIVLFLPIFGLIISYFVSLTNCDFDLSSFTFMLINQSNNPLYLPCQLNFGNSSYGSVNVDSWTTISLSSRIYWISCGIFIWENSSLLLLCLESTNFTQERFLTFFIHFFVYSLTTFLILFTGCHY